jgi:hypothetical protein
MTCEYQLSGSFVVAQEKPGFMSALCDLRNTLEDWFENCTLEVQDGELMIDLCEWDCFYSVPEKADAAITEFASKFAAEPAQIDTRYNSEDTEGFLVGPEGFDRDEFSIFLIDQQIEMLQRQRAALEAKRLKGA